MIPFFCDKLVYTCVSHYLNEKILQNISIASYVEQKENYNANAVVRANPIEPTVFHSWRNKEQIITRKKGRILWKMPKYINPCSQIYDF
jgi:hypothetical protein